MGDAIWITVDFKVPKSWYQAVTWLPEYFETWADEMPDAWVHHISGQGNYGLLDGDIENLLDELRRQHVPFVAHQDDDYGSGSRDLVHDGYTEFSRTSDEHLGYLSREQWDAFFDDPDVQIIDMVEAHFFMAEALDACFNTSVEEIGIGHLSAWPAPDEDEMLDEFACALHGVDFTLRQIGAT